MQFIDPETNRPFPPTAAMIAGAKSQAEYVVKILMIHLGLHPLSGHKEISPQAKDDCFIKAWNYAASKIDAASITNPAQSDNFTQVMVDYESRMKKAIEALGIGENTAAVSLRTFDQSLNKIISEYVGPQR